MPGAGLEVGRGILGRPCAPIGEGNPPDRV